MIIEILFIFFFTWLLVGLLVPVGRYRTHHSRSKAPQTAARDGDELSEPEAEGAGVGLTMFFFFILLFPLILAGNYWVTPYGPTFMEISWVPIVVMGILLTLLIAAISPRHPREASLPVRDNETPVEAGAAAIFGFSFFLLLFISLGIIVAAWV